MDSLIRSRYSNYKQHKRYISEKKERKSLTQQQFKDECDVNNILARYKKTGMISHLAKHQGNFGDFSTFEDYQTSLHKHMTAQNAFNDLPSDIRAKFENDPGRLVQFLSDPKNNAEAVKLGLKIQKMAPESLQSSMEKALENNDKKRETKSVKKD